MPNPQLKLQEVVSLHEYPPVDALGCCYTISRIFQSHLHYSYFPWDLCLHCFCLCSNYFLHSLLFHHFLSFPMSYLPTSPSYEPSHMPLPSSQPIWITLLSTSWIYALYTLVIATPTILIAIESLPSYQMLQFLFFLMYSFLSQ